MRIIEKFLPQKVQDDGTSRVSHSPRREGTVVDTIVLHCISNIVLPDEGMDYFDFISNPAHRASYHFCCSGKDDGAVYNTVPMKRRAWHAGVSEFRGRRNLNETSIGISMVMDCRGWGEFVEALADPQAYTDVHYKKVAYAIRHAMNRFPNITRDRITTHKEVSHRGVRPDPKIDPGEGFDPDRVLHELKVLRAGTV